MIQMTRATCLLVLIAATISQPLCPRSKEVGNFLNYLHLFKEEADTLLSFYNAKTSVEVIFTSSVLTGTITDHRVVFRVTDTNIPRRIWIYAVWVKLNSQMVIESVVNFMKFRYLDDPTTIDIVTQLFRAPAAVTLAPVTTDCFLPVIKLEYDYFYYMFANYYKNGDGIKKPIIPLGP